MKIGKRLFSYALLYKKILLVAMAMLILSVVVELSGPFIAKYVIDDHLLGIEKPWHETEAHEKQAVAYKGHWYKRADHFAPGEQKGREVRILQVGRSFVFVPQHLPFDGKREWKDGELTIQKGKEHAVMPANKISASQLYSFYKPEVNGIVVLLGIYFVLMMAASFFEYGRIYFLQSSANRIIQRLRNDLFDKIHQLPMRFYDRTPAGGIVSRLTSDTEAVKELFISVLTNFVTGIVYLVVTFVALFLLNVKLALVCLLIIPTLFIWIVLYRKLSSKYNRIIRARLSDINGYVNEMIVNIPVIRAFHRQKETRQKFEHLNEEHYRYQSKMLSLDALTSHNLANSIRTLALAVAVWYFGSASLSAEGAITFGVVYAFIDYLGRMFQPVVGIVNQLAQFEQSVVSAERIFEIMDMESMDEVKSEALIKTAKGQVVFDYVTFGYEPGVPVLKDISLKAEPGETIALVGHTGAGKSSIINVLLRFYEIQQGRISLDGRDTKDMTAKELRSQIGIVLQDTFLFPGTLASNISLDNPAISRSQIEAALTAVGGMDMVRAMPKGLDEPIGEQGLTLSVGQKQLIAFARALAHDPAVLILDEATANIDTETEAIIQNALKTVQKERTTFIIAHRLSTIHHADQILVLKNGEIIERGNHQSLIAEKGAYYRMSILQQGGSQTAG